MGRKLPCIVTNFVTIRPIHQACMRRFGQFTCTSTQSMAAIQWTIQAHAHKYECSMAAIWLTIQAQVHKYEHSMAAIWLMMQTQMHKYEHSMAAIFDSFELTPN